MNKGLAGALIAAASLAALAAGCSSNRKEAKLKNPAPCPNIVVLEDAARLVEFAGEERIEDVAFTAEIEDVSLACRYVGDKPINAEVSIRLAFGRGPKAATDKKQYGYWVAVTRTNREVIEKKEFIVPVDFGGDDAVERVRQKIGEIVIPRKGEQTSGTNFEVVVGLVLTPQQAIYNRSGKSLKFPEL
ncbi:MAG TPA: hypothetical protein DDZ68_17095 [Parvularcula sp.]|nr:hypothetical protein [Parvularcula sp.]HBS30210.1 hypothetical protein [Parvularcula sp.]HBS34534.1 hypothetical protein [Parvularcula sp.]